MKHLPSIIATLIIGAVIVTMQVLGLPNRPAAAAQPTPAAQAACDDSRSVQVSGTAVLNVSPDRATIQLGVQTNGVTVQEVEQANSQTTQAVIRALQGLGVEGQNIATDWYVIEPLYESYDSLHVKGYRINNTIAVTLRDVSKTSQVIATALRAGANQVGSVEFYTSELRKYRDQARELAMQAAQEKAAALASAAGAQAGCILTINESSWSYYNGSWYGRGGMNQWTQNVVQNVAPSQASANPGDEPISLGQISVKAEITASFALE